MTKYHFSRFFLFLVLFSLLLAACQRTSDTAVPVSDPVPAAAEAGQESIALVRQFHEALNAYDAAGMQALVSDGFTMKIVYGYGDTPLAVVAGGEALTDPVVDRAGLADLVSQGLAADHWQMTVSDLKVDGAQVTGRYNGSGDYVRGLGIGNEYGSMEAMVSDGRIQSITYTDHPVFALNATIAEQRQAEAANLAVVRRFYDELAAGNADVILEVHPEIITMHYAGGSDDVPAQPFRDDLAALKAANPDLHAEIHEMTAVGNYVFTELTWKATHTGDYFGIPATGQQAVHNGIVVRRLENGLIVESWEMFDDLAFFAGLGMTPSWEELLSGAGQPAPEAEAPAPLPELSMATLVGTWTQFDDEAQGYNWLIISADGAIQGKHGPSPVTGILVFDGQIQVDGSVVTITDNRDCPDGETYESRYINHTSIRFDPLAATCELLPEKAVWKIAGSG